MLKLRVVQALYGDCLILQSGYGKRTKHILIDGGPGRVYRSYLLPELERMAAAGFRLDLVVLTHVDNDHILGLLELVEDLQKAQEKQRLGVISVRRLWHNAFDQIIPKAGKEARALETMVARQPVGEEAPEAPASPASSAPASSNPDIIGGPIRGTSFGIGEGMELMAVDKTLSIPRNVGFPNGLVMLDPPRQPVRLGSTRLWVIGPPEKNLERLRKTWMRWLDKKNGRISFAPGEEAEPVIHPDDSVNNLSSIILLAEAGRKRILLTGDARSEDIISGLEEVGLLPKGGTMTVNTLKVPHHGSARNCVGDLFDRVLAETYVISADGRHGNPDPETLNWLVDAACRQQRVINIFATNPTDSLRDLERLRPPEQNFYRLTYLPEGQNSALLS